MGMNEVKATSAELACGLCSWSGPTLVPCERHVEVAPAPRVAAGKAAELVRLGVRAERARAEFEESPASSHGMTSCEGVERLWRQALTTLQAAWLYGMNGGVEEAGMTRAQMLECIGEFLDPIEMVPPVDCDAQDWLERGLDGIELGTPWDVARCRVCGCTDDAACEGGCSWASPGHDLCSSCSARERAVRDRLDALFAERMDAAEKIHGSVTAYAISCDLDEEHAACLDTAIEVAFNPRDDDIDQASIMVNAVLDAAAFIASLPCTCDVPDGDPCDRCSVLGRFGDVELSR